MMSKHIYGRLLVMDIGDTVSLQKVKLDTNKLKPAKTGQTTDKYCFHLLATDVLF